MAGFDAGTVVSPLDFTLRPYVDFNGRVPEPSDDQIAEFLNAAKDIMVAAQKDLNLEVDPRDNVAMLAALEKLDPTVVLTTMKSMAEAYATLCSGKPSVKQLMGLPMRVRIKFFEWLRDEVINPEAGPGAGTAPVIPLTRAAAG